MVLASGVNVSELSSLVGVTVVLAGFIGACVTYLLRRRAQTGNVGTSEASTLWTQSQAMLAQLGAEKLKAEEQRDRLIEMQTTQVLPAMTAMNTSLKEISDALLRIDGILARLSEILTRLDGRYGTRRKVPLHEMQGGRDVQGLRHTDPRSCAAGRREDGDHQRDGRIHQRHHRHPQSPRTGTGERKWLTTTRCGWPVIWLPHCEK